FRVLTPESLDRYASSDSNGIFKCKFSFTLAITENDQVGSIQVTAVTLTNKFSMITKKGYTYVFNFESIPFDVGLGSIDIDVNNQIGYQTTLNVPFHCNDVEFLYDTLYDSYQFNLLGPVAVFRVNNFVQEGPELTLTFTSQSLYLVKCELISFNVYKVMFGYSSGSLWGDVNNNLIVNIEHPNFATPIFNPITLKSNYISGNQITQGNLKVYPLSPTKENRYYRVYPYFEFSSTIDAPFLTVYSGVSSLISRLYPVMGNRTDGVFLNFLQVYSNTYSMVSFINNPGGVTNDQITFTSILATPSYSLTINTGSFVDGIIISNVNTNQPFREFQISPLVLSDRYISSITTPTLYPYAFSSGNAIQYQRSDEYFISPFAHGVYGFHYFNYMQEITLPSSNIDDTPPNIESVSYVTIANVIIYTVHITDDKSGFQKLIPYGNYTSLTSGTLLDGVYEFQVDLSKQVVSATKLAVCDFVLNCRDVFISSFQTSDGGNFKNDYEFKAISDINRIYWKYNNIDVSNDNVNNTLYICSSIQNLKPHLAQEKNLFNLLSSPSHSYDATLVTMGIYLDGCYEFDYVIYKNTMTGMAKYLFWMVDQTIESSYLETYFGEESKLKIKSINGDELGPLITNVQLLPGNSITIQLVDTSIEWLITIEDKFNGFKKGKITIAGDIGLVKYNFDLTTLDLISGDEKYGVYKLVVPILYKCKSQKYFIQYVELEDNMGYQTIYIQDGKYDGNLPDSMIHILHDVDTLSSIKTQCMWAQTDTEPPQLSSFTFSPNTIDTTFSGVEFDNTPRLVTFNFVVTDNEGVLNSSIPIIYLQDQSQSIIQKSSQLKSYGGNSASYQCKFNIPYGFGFPNGIKVSVFGMVDLQSNIRGYSMSQLFDAGFENTINVSPILNESISILSVTPHGRDYSQFFITGRNIRSTDLLAIQNKDYILLALNGPIINSGTFALFSYTSMPTFPFYITLRRGSNEYSNTFKVSLNESSSSSSDSSTAFSSSSDSSSMIASSDTNESSGNTSSNDQSSSGSPQECLNNCGGINNGKCKQYGCVCKSPWVGLDCSSQVIVIDPNIDPTLPQTNFTIPGTNDYFNQGANITFANQVLEMNPYSLKYSVNISQYSFSSSLNTIQLVLSASIQSSDGGVCSGIQLGDTVESESEFIKMQVDDHSLYGRFIKRGIVDGRIRQITNTPLNKEFKS
ncbi:hypothetical protein CYY_010190, partial [Polysphondylium violaceum]